MWTRVRAILAMLCVGVAGFIFGVLFANTGSFSNVKTIVAQKGVNALFAILVQTNQSCEVPARNQSNEDEIFFLSCGGIF